VSEAVVPLEHPLQRCVAHVSAAIEEASGSGAHFLTTAAKREVLLGLTRQIARLEGLRLGVLAAAGDVAQEDAARSPGAWLAVEARLERPEARRLQKLADSLDARSPVLAAALLAGDVSRRQAEVIAAALDELPREVGPDVRSKAEAHLVEQAAEFGPRELRVLGSRILAVVAPDLAEDHERRALEAAERRARLRMRVSRRDLGGGLARFVIDIPLLHGDLLSTQLHAFASPRRDHLEGADRRDPDTGEHIPYSRLLAQAFCSLLERLPTDSAPQQGGKATSLVVTIDHDQLMEEVGTAELSTGNRVSVGEARRLACTAGILPVVLSGTSQPLDVGRARRFHTPAMRTAMEVRDRECRADGCDIPAAWCEAHHVRPWAESRGPTNVDDGLLLCSFHHHRAHDRRREMRRLANGDVKFHRKP